MTATEMAKAGLLLDAVAWSDEELELVLEALPLVIWFLEETGCGKLIVGPLRREQERFEAMKRARQQQS